MSFWVGRLKLKVKLLKDMVDAWGFEPTPTVSIL
jgi:hypothetical protein